MKGTSLSKTWCWRCRRWREAHRRRNCNVLVHLFNYAWVCIAQPYSQGEVFTWLLVASAVAFSLYDVDKTGSISKHNMTLVVTSFFNLVGPQVTLSGLRPMAFFFFWTVFYFRNDTALLDNRAFQHFSLEMWSLNWWLLPNFLLSFFSFFLLIPILFYPILNNRQEVW